MWDVGDNESKLDDDDDPINELGEPVSDDDDEDDDAPNIGASIGECCGGDGERPEPTDAALL